MSEKCSYFFENFFFKNKFSKILIKPRVVYGKNEHLYEN